MKKIFFISSLLISLIGCSGENFADMQIEKPKNPQENPQNPITPNHKDSILKLLINLLLLPHLQNLPPIQGI
jgi:lipoprotein